ncbi:DNA-processing protein DprA [Planktothrix sp. FACHB-1365]|uniref:DNA-processing protein DprA n=1 Tax=Planktothrix sp. FACHB-1365 TaxID=2692855 RepID=UPI001682F9DB|nr:DNA-processing protein DprA [Planktothrix sp. FACHB-1365]MBD2483595.1 DNA-protecting protein DprA [Planktothrix sp. FACHB-1365]
MEERGYWLAWSQINGVGSVSIQRLQHHFKTLEMAWNATEKELIEVDGFGKQTVDKIIQQRSQFNPKEFLEKHIAKNPYFWTPADAEYPRLLLEIPTFPPVLYYRGIVEPQENRGITPTVAIVGTRTPTEYGRRWTRKISMTLARRGFTIVSGLAAGIDTEAHRSCLEVGGRTIAALGTGVDIIYPKENFQLCERVMNQGLLISEYPSGTKPNPRHFPQRNRIIAGLSRATFVMEAPQKSGALITAHVANEFCRDVYVLPGRLDDEKSQGCLKLINGGASMIPVNLEELLEQLGAMPPLDEPQQSSLFSLQPEPAKPLPDLDPELTQVLQAFSSEPTAFDQIIVNLNLEAGSLSAALLQLELLGLVEQLPGMRYRRID